MVHSAEGERHEQSLEAHVASIMETPGGKSRENGDQSLNRNRPVSGDIRCFQDTNRNTNFDKFISSSCDTVTIFRKDEFDSIHFEESPGNLRKVLTLILRTISSGVYSTRLTECLRGGCNRHDITG